MNYVLGPNVGIWSRIFNTGGGGSPPWTPATLFSASEAGGWYDPSNLSTLWQDSAMTTAVTATGQPVALIEDQSGNDNHAYITTDSKRPLLQVDGDGKYYLDFDGIDDGLITDDNIAWGTESTWCHAYQKALGVTAQRLLGSPNQTAFGISRGTTNFECFVANYTSGSGRVAFNAADSDAKRVLVYDRDSVGDVGNIYLDSALAATDGHDVSSISAIMSFSSRGAGASVVSASRWYGGVYLDRKLTATERGKVTVYLADKAGVTLP